MTAISFNEAYRLARSVGLGNSAATTAVAIAYAESGLRTDAVGDVGLQDAKWGPSIGLWQIRSLKAESGKGTTRDATRLKDAAFNARAMASISGHGSDFTPWSKYKNGAYKQYLTLAAAAAGTESPSKGAPRSVVTAVPVDSGSSSSNATQTGLHIPNPLGYGGLFGLAPKGGAKAGEAAAGALGDVGKLVATGLLWTAALGLGVTLITIGAYRAARGAS